MTLNELAQQINDNARAKGFWDADRNMGEMLMLAVSELAEALEEHRAGNPVEYTPVHRQECSLVPARGGLCAGTCKPEGVAVELADCIIRCLDTMHSLGVDVDGVVARKMAYNASRPFKHGKAY